MKPARLLAVLSGVVILLLPIVGSAHKTKEVAVQVVFGAEPTSSPPPANTRLR